MKGNKENEKDPYESINKRLDALIRILVEVLNDKKSERFNKTALVRLLNSAGLTPTEIAKIMGKKDRRAVSPHLYSKPKKKNKERLND